MIGIISDTHENIPATKKAVEILKQRKADIVVHCGDIISPVMIPLFEGLPMKFVYGNNDGEVEGLNVMAQKYGFEDITFQKQFTYQNKSFYVYHGTNPSLLQNAIDSQQHDYILTGHTHIIRDETIGTARVINPGALFNVEKYTIAFLDVSSNNLEFIEIHV